MANISCSLLYFEAGARRRSTSLSPKKEVERPTEEYFSCSPAALLQASIYVGALPDPYA